MALHLILPTLREHQFTKAVKHQPLLIRTRSYILDIKKKMRLARMAMAMEDGGGASSSVAQPAAMGMGYERHFQPPPFWSTPTPYLFIGFAVVMALIAVALAVLLCSRRKDDEGRRGGGDGEVMALRVLAPLDREDAAVPRVLVVMAGHSAPSFLASAAPFTSFAAAGDDAKPQHVGKDGADAV